MIGVFLGLVVLLAWVCDDAFITFRSIDNLVHGHGLRWNTAERVQVFTHPLWMLLHVPLVAITREVYLTTMALGATLSALTVWLVATRIAPTQRLGWLAVLALTVSPAYLGWTTSGLENPLTRLLVVGLALALLGDPRRRLARCGLLAGLGALCRPDAFLLFLPALVHSLRRHRGGHRLAILAGSLAPLLLWIAFASFYFGSPLPNTAWAKLGAGVPWIGRLTHGLTYLGVSAARDPWTALLTIGGWWWVLRQPPGPLRPMVWGGSLMLLYLVWIGGDFALGRFLDGPLLCALLPALRTPGAIALTERVHRRRAISAAAILLVCVAVQAAGAVTVDVVDSHGIADERRAYALQTGLLNGVLAKLRDPTRPWPDHSWRSAGLAARRAAETSEDPPIVVDRHVGLLGYFAGPFVHVVDQNALTDPLLARLPAAPPEPSLESGATSSFWRAGHLGRALPAGYLETLETGRNRFQDDSLSGLWQELELAHRAPLLAPGRDRALFALLVGSYRPEVASYVARHPDDFGLKRPEQPE